MMAKVNPRLIVNIGSVARAEFKDAKGKSLTLSFTAGGSTTLEGKDAEMIWTLLDSGVSFFPQSEAAARAKIAEAQAKAQAERDNTPELAVPPGIVIAK